MDLNNIIHNISTFLLFESTIRQCVFGLYICFYW